MPNTDIIKEIIHRYTQEPEENITAEADFTKFKGCDSLAQVEIVIACEDEFNIAISDEESEVSTSLYALNRLIEKKKVAA